MQRNLLSRVQEFARTAHDHRVSTTIEGIKRPQAVHLQEVADLVWASGGTDEEIAAAWLHDSVEDTDVTLLDIEEKFGHEVASIVEALTDTEEYVRLPQFERKSKQAERVRGESESVKRVKIADQTSNVQFLATDPPTSMDFETCRDYIHGAKLIADECAGVSPLLDGLFDAAYQKALIRYGNRN